MSLGKAGYDAGGVVVAAQFLDMQGRPRPEPPTYKWWVLAPWWSPQPHSLQLQQRGIAQETTT